MPGTWDRNRNPNLGSLPLQAVTYPACPQQPRLPGSLLKDQEVTGLTLAAEATDGTGQTPDTAGGKQSPGGAAPPGSLTLTGDGRGAWSMEHRSSGD